MLSTKLILFLGVLNYDVGLQLHGIYIGSAK